MKIKKYSIRFIMLIIAISLLLTACSDNGENATESTNRNNLSQSDIDLDNQPEEDLTLSGVLYDFIITVGGDKIAFPLTLEEFQAYGWEFISSLVLAETIADNTISAVSHDKNSKRVWLGIGNMSGGTLPIEQSTVYNISSSVENEDYAVIELPKGIILGVSTKNDVLQAFGYPTFSDYYEEYDLEHMRYGDEPFKNTEIVINRSTGIVTEIHVTNFPQRYE